MKSLHLSIVVFAIISLNTARVFASECGSADGPFGSASTSSTSDFNDSAVRVNEIKEGYIDALAKYLIQVKTLRVIDGDPRSYLYTENREVTLPVKHLSQKFLYEVSILGEIAVKELAKEVVKEKSSFRRGAILRLISTSGIAATSTEKDLLDALTFFSHGAIPELGYNDFGEVDQGTENMDDLWSSVATSWRARLSDNQITVVNLVDTLAVVARDSEAVARELLTILNHLEDEAVSIDRAYRAIAISALRLALHQSTAEPALSWVVANIADKEFYPVNTVDILRQPRYRYLQDVLEHHTQVKYSGRALEVPVTKALKWFREAQLIRGGSAMMNQAGLAMSNQEFDFIADLHAYEMVWQLQDGKTPFVFDEIDRIIGEVKDVKLRFADVQIIHVYVHALKVFEVPELFHDRVANLIIKILRNFSEDLRSTVNLMHSTRSAHREATVAVRNFISFLDELKQIKIGRKSEVVLSLKAAKGIEIPDSQLRSQFLEALRSCIENF